MQKLREHSLKHQRSDERHESSFLRWLLIASAVAAGIVADHFFPGWGRAVVLTISIFVCLVAFCRAVWGLTFWAIVLGLLALHLVLIGRFHSQLESLTLPDAFIAAVVEIIAIAIVLGIAFPDKKRSPLQH